MSEILIYKPFSLSPLETIELYRRSHPELAQTKMCYAGRLDPMAEGILLILTAEDCKNRTQYERLPKTYEFEIIPGLTTDTYDIMGLLTAKPRFDTVDRSDEISDLLRTMVGKHLQPYPPFSSARVKGKPLYYWSRQGLLNTVTIPSKEVEIYSAVFLGKRVTSIGNVVQIAVDRVSRTNGEFRQKEIIQQWESEFREVDLNLQVYKCVIECSSGTYIRSVAHTLGEMMGTGAIVLGIKRTKLGRYTEPDCLQITESGTVTTHKAGDRTGTA